MEIIWCCPPFKLQSSSGTALRRILFSGVGGAVGVAAVSDGLETVGGVTVSDGLETVGGTEDLCLFLRSRVL